MLEFQEMQLQHNASGYLKRNLEMKYVQLGFFQSSVHNEKNNKHVLLYKAKNSLELFHKADMNYNGMTPV